MDGWVAQEEGYSQDDLDCNRLEREPPEDVILYSMTTISCEERQKKRENGSAIGRQCRVRTPGSDYSLCHSSGTTRAKARPRENG